VEEWKQAMGNIRSEDPLKLDVVYYSAPIPRNLAVLTVLGYQISSRDTVCPQDTPTARG
jgi:hypothetical protein